jgi:hypothetical protein
MQKSTAQERPWSDHEKVGCMPLKHNVKSVKLTHRHQVSLLAEMIKISSVPVSALLKLIREYDVHPQWEDMPLPEGKSVLQSLPCPFS